MKKSFNYLIISLLFMPLAVRAQMPHDAIYMGKNQLCVAGMYGYSAWDHYWENTMKRENFNIGTLTTQSAMIMPAYGISKRVNVILSLPYVWTSASAGNLMGQHGVQDISAWLKVNAVQVGGFSLHGIVGGSIPVGSYVPDFLPMSIGLQCRTATLRLLANYRHKPTGIYLTAHGSYGWRSNIKIDRDAYQADDRVYNVNQVHVPNVYDAAVRLGVLRKGWQTEVFAERSACFEGDNIRRNDMPFPTNNMRSTLVGWYGKFQPHHLGVNARVGYVVDGINVGQSTSYTVGVLYQINFKH